MNEQLLQSALRIRDWLERNAQRVVLVESCTGGWIASSFACIPGISQWWCGSLVVYRCGSKEQWLGINPHLLSAPDIGPVSAVVTKLLAEQALKHTSEADLAIAVTGDLGPGVPVEKDGKVFGALCFRRNHQIHAFETRLALPPPIDSQDIPRRQERLLAAAQWVLRQTCMILESSSAGAKQ